MNQTLYRKYRPKTFAEVEGQEHIVRTLAGALSSRQVGHAYLFCGPRGTGKTTLARLFAKTLNCQHYSSVRGLTSNTTIEPCNQCVSCLAINEGNSLDLIEIDAASNRGIDEIRNLKEAVRVVAPGGGRKIFIIDEVHMLTKDAFNALLKTLEEPPAQVVFILATTEVQKLPDTILSRVQRFDFKKLSHERIIKKLQRMAKAEKIEIDEPALAALANHAGGSLRDAESALAKLIAYAGQQVSGAQALEILGLVPQSTHQQFLQTILTKNPSLALAKINELHDSGIDLEHFTRQFINYTREQLLMAVTRPPIANSLAPGELVKVMNAMIKTKNEFRNSPVPQLPLELAVLELINGAK